MPLDNVIYLPILFIFLLILFKKVNLLNENIIYSKHKTLTKNKTSPVIIGGIYIYFILFFYFQSNLVNLKIFSFLILLIGLFSDKNLIVNPLTRLLLQISILTSLILVDGLQIKSISISFIDILLNNELINIFLTIFCFLVLINGSNFLDGLNGLLSGYFILVIFTLLFIDYNNLDVIIENNYHLKFLLIGLIIFTFFNFLGYSFLGDGGAYLISLLLGYFLIESYNNNNSISPYFVALMLWYPAFENLFSLSRRLYFKSKVSKPDNYHLHQLIFKFFAKKFSTKNLNSLTSITILFYNFLIFCLSSKFYYHSKILIGLISINVLIYLFLYFAISKYLVIDK